MSEWEFLHDMDKQGYSKDEIMDAMASGAAPWEWDYIERQEREAKLEKLESLRNKGEISREEFKKRKAEIFG